VPAMLAVIPSAHAATADPVVTASVTGDTVSVTVKAGEGLVKCNIGLADSDGNDTHTFVMGALVPESGVLGPYTKADILPGSYLAGATCFDAEGLPYGDTDPFTVTAPLKTADMPVSPTQTEVYGPNNDTVTKATTEGVVYTCPAWVNNTMTCTAAAAEGYKLPDGAKTEFVLTDKNTQAPVDDWKYDTWGKHGRDNLPCSTGGHWVLTGKGITAAEVSFDGGKSWSAMTQNGKNGSWSYDSTGSVTTDTVVQYRYKGDVKNSVFTLSHCTVNNTPSPTPNPTDSPKSTPSPSPSVSTPPSANPSPSTPTRPAVQLVNNRNAGGPTLPSRVETDLAGLAWLAVPLALMVAGGLIILFRRPRKVTQEI
jgi:hypothetical protein